jgi:hypothetical protein
MDLSFLDERPAPSPEAGQHQPDDRHRAPAGIGWQEEHRLEVEALGRMAERCTDPWWQSVLRGLAAERVTDLDKHLAWGERLVLVVTDNLSADCRR